MHPRRVLVVEDDPLFRQLFGEVLARSGYMLRIVGSVQEAMTVLRTWRPHVVLTDLHLPDGEGPRVIRRLHGGVRALLIAMSGDLDPAAVAALRRAGAFGCIDKEQVFDEQLLLLLSQA